MISHPESKQVRLLVANLSSHTSETQIRALFEEFGDVCEVRLLRSGSSGRFRGNASVLLRHRRISGEISIPDDLVLNGNPLGIFLCHAGASGTFDQKQQPRRLQRQLY